MNVQELLGKAAQQWSVGRAFGTAYEKDGALVIPVALVAGGAGGGEGASRWATSASFDEGKIDRVDQTTDAEPQGGSGGGFGAMVIPVGVYVVRDEKVRWVPAINANLVIVVAFMLVRVLVRARRKGRQRA